MAWTCDNSKGLIEAYWNVNREFCVYSVNSMPRFNRSILKCKRVPDAERWMDAHWFNRSILKCKRRHSDPGAQDRKWFNRSILKCKHVTYVGRYDGLWWFNRSILKCKLSSSFIFCNISKGLIEAYWNVNLIK